MRALVFLAFLAGCATPRESPRQPVSGSEYLYLWTAARDTTAPDFLAVFDVRADTGRYGAMVTSVPVPGVGHGPHHSEHELGVDGTLFVNGFRSGKSFIFDVREPAAPRLAGEFGEVAGFHHPHSFLRLPGGNVLATFQMRHGDSGMATGGLVEMTSSGNVVRSAPATGPGVPAGLRPYSGAVVPTLDRIVTSTTDMDERNPYRANQVQVWRMSTLELLHTITLPAGPLGDEGDYTAEPRVLSDGRTVMVSTFNCGLYLLEGIDTDQPSGRLVASFPRKPDTYCAIPVVAGRFWITTVPAIPGVVSLDLSDPANPREAGRLTLGPDDIPHWISVEPGRRRVVITGYGAMRNRVLLATFDSTTGALGLDERFRPPGAERPGFEVAGTPHGAVFSRP